MTIWAVFRTAAAEKEVGWELGDKPTMNDRLTFAERLTGWVALNALHPGDIFAEDHDLRVYGKKLIVVQRTGRDI